MKAKCQPPASYGLVEVFDGLPHAMTEHSVADMADYLKETNRVRLPSGHILEPCRHCGAKADVTISDEQIRFVCSGKGCMFREFAPGQLDYAVRDWNTPNTGRW